jgi:hypothetical protein
MNIETVLEHIILDYDLTIENFDARVKEIGYITFFNQVTERCLGKIETVHESKSRTSSALIYLADDVVNRLIPSFDTIQINSFYLGVICNGHLEFNYKNYQSFLEELFSLRKSFKKQLIIKQDEMLNIKQFLIKIYCNCVYGMLDNPESVVSTTKLHPREYVSETAKSVLLQIVSFLLNKSIPVYYIDTDEIFVQPLGEGMIKELYEMFKNIPNLIDTTISDIHIDSKKDSMCYIKAKKNMVIFEKNHARIIGNFIMVDDDLILINNKDFFGKHYFDF